MKKKLLSLALAAVMVMGMATTAFAANPTATNENATTTFSKTYTGTGAPAETFYLEQVGNVTQTQNSNVSESELAQLNLDEITVEGVTADGGCTLIAKTESAVTAGGTGSFTIGLPQYTKVGVYNYVLKEVNSSTSGVTYYGSEIYMVVTVEDDNGVLKTTIAYHNTSDTTSESNKIEEIKNTYAAGTLNVTKTVAGNLGDKSTDNTFSFTVTFTAKSGTTWDGTGVTESVDGTEAESITLTTSTKGSVYTYTFSLYHGQTISFGNLPDGVTYSVVENNTTTSTVNEVEVTVTESGYTVDYDGSETGTISSETTASTTVTNTKEGEVDTGINLDTLPYIMILAVVFAGVVYMVFRKRMSDEF